MDDTLQHHGILGQKWGVRRYQNYNGSYTQAGLKRYAKAKAEYEHQKERYKSIKNNKSAANQIKRTNAKVAMVKAKRHQDNVYKHLKQDKMADQGKELYAKGVTIRNNNKFNRNLGKAASFALMGVRAYNKLNLGADIRYFVNKKTGDFSKGYNARVKADQAVKVIGAVSVAALVGATVKGIRDNSRNNKLRAYYNHSSNYKKY